MPGGAMKGSARRMKTKRTFTGKIWSNLPKSVNLYQ